MDDAQYDSDPLLVEGLRRGEEAAAESFVQRYMPLIRATLARVIRGQPAELDSESNMVAERLIRAVSGTKPATNLRSLVAKTAFNAGIDWYRREKRRREHDSGQDASEISPESIHRDVRDDEEVREAEYAPVNAEAAAVFQKALETLVPEEVRLLLLREEGYAYEEIAEMLRDGGKAVKEATWRKRHERAYAKLLEASRRLAAGNPDVLRALEEGQRQVREYKTSPRPEAS